MTMTPLDHAINNLEIYTNTIPGVNIERVQKTLLSFTRFFESAPYTRRALTMVLTEIGIIVNNISNITPDERSLIKDLAAIRRTIYYNYRSGVSDLTPTIKPTTYICTVSTI